MYHIDRTIREMDNESFGDGSHITYVNGAYTDESDQIVKLMHDFRCASAADMYFDVLAECVRYFKETEGGRVQVCKMAEDLQKKPNKHERRPAGLTVPTAQKSNPAYCFLRFLT